MKRLGIVLLLALGAAGLTACEPPPKVTLVIGDSNTVGTSWATMLGSNCTPDRWAWGGVGITESGYTGGAGPITLDDNGADMLAGHDGAHVVVMLGTNDVLARQTLPTQADLNRIATELRSAGAASVRYATIPPFGANRADDLTTRRETLNARLLAVGALDYRPAFGDHLTPSQTVDGIHLSAEGHGRLAWVASTMTATCG